MTTIAVIVQDGGKPGKQNKTAIVDASLEQSGIERGTKTNNVFCLFYLLRRMQ